MAGFKACDKQSNLYGLGFRTGEKLCFFCHSLYWLIRHVDLIELKVDFLNDGEFILYGEMTYPELRRLIKDAKLNRVHYHARGISWFFLDQSRGMNDDFSDYPGWHDKMLRAFESERLKNNKFYQ